EQAFVALADAFARRGRAVEVRNRCAVPLDRNGVRWRPIGAGFPAAADLYIANRGHRLIGKVRAEKSVFWLHNPGRYLRKPRYVAALLRHRPVIVALGPSHAATVPWWLPSGGRAVIPLGLPAELRAWRPPRPPPAPKAIFASNPLRGLDWLLDLWGHAIHPAMPAAELHLYCGPAAYGESGEKARAMEMVLARAEAMGGARIYRHEPLPRAALAEALLAARVMLYRGDLGETFCLALAEAQALGVPAVVQELGAVAERVIDGVTGMVVRDDPGFAAAAVALLRDDALWQRQHAAALDRQRGLSWDEVAARFEGLGACA
ncbi:MAG: glycosyltransferase, partial [Stellaceae bacterium]